MISTAPSSTAFLYVEADVPAGQTRGEWRRERDAARQAARTARRRLRLPFPRLARWAT